MLFRSILILVITSTIGLFYYLRIVTAMYQRPVESALVLEPLPRRAPAAILVLAVLLVVLVWLGVYPTALVNVIQSATRSLI